MMQLFALSVCPEIEIQLFDMKNNIIYFTPPESSQEMRSQGGWIRIDNEAAFGLIESFWFFGLAHGRSSRDSNSRSTGIMVF